MKIAVIGATGMLGNHTARAVVAAGHSLVIGHRLSSNLDLISDLKGERRVCDLDDPVTMALALRDVDGVINCAGYYPVKPCSWQKDVKRALCQMEKFYAACETAGVARIVYVGAAIALPPAGKCDPAGADDCYPGQPKNTNNYLQVKWALDHLALKKAAEGLPVVIGIPAMTFGEYDTGPTTGRLIVELANQSIPAYVGGNRNVVYAGDAARGLVLACEKGKVGERYLFGGENLSMDNLVKLICEVGGAGRPGKIPLWLAKTMALIQGKRYQWLGGDLPRLDKTAIAVLSLGQFLDDSKSRKELGYQPQTSVRDAVQKALVWFKAQGYVVSPEPNESQVLSQRRLEGKSG